MKNEANYIASVYKVKTDGTFFRPLSPLARVKPPTRADLSIVGRVMSAISAIKSAEHLPVTFVGRGHDPQTGLLVRLYRAGGSIFAVDAKIERKQEAECGALFAVRTDAHTALAYTGGLYILCVTLSTRSERALLEYLK